MEAKEPIRKTLLGNWLKNKAPDVLDVVGDLLPDAGALGVVRNLISSKEDEVKAEAELYLKTAEAEAEITKRWQADAASGHALSQRVRPLIVLGSCLVFVAFTVLDSLQVLVIRTPYINLLESLLLTSVGGYFVLRSADKWTGKKA